MIEGYIYLVIIFGLFFIMGALSELYEFFIGWRFPR